MRLRTGHGPNDWTENVPESAHIRARSAYANVPAATIPDMRPILSYGGTKLEANTGRKGIFLQGSRR